MNKKLDLVRFSGTLPANLSAKLKEISLKADRSMNAIFNIAITEYCDKYEQKGTTDN